MLPRLAYELGLVGGVVGGVLLAALGMTVRGEENADALVGALRGGMTGAAAGGLDAPPAVATCALEEALSCHGVCLGDRVANVTDADPTMWVACPAAAKADAAAGAAVGAAWAAVAFLAAAALPAVAASPAVPAIRSPPR